MSLYIGGRPTFQYKNLFGKPNQYRGTFPLNQKRYYYFFSARYALKAGIQALGMKPGDAVLLPSYNCWTEIDPFLHSNIKLSFYKVDKTLFVDLDDLVNKINSDVRAIVVTHFLGFPQPVNEIRKICRERSIFLIEDCAHAFLSSSNEKYLGSYGDFSIFSLLKTLPIPNGGVLLINNSDIIYKHDPQKPSLFSTLFYAAELLKHKSWGAKHFMKEHLVKLFYDGSYISLFSLRLLLAAFRKYVNPRGLYLVRPDSYLFVDSLCSWEISTLSKRIINGTDFERVKAIRRRNFEYLLEHFLKNDRGILPYRLLPPGVCPLFFPIILESSEKRNAVYSALRKRNVTTYPWWTRFHESVPWDDFPEAVYLKQRLFGLPIHQDLTLRHLDRLLEEFERAHGRI
jgi:perosamine synthetase